MTCACHLSRETYTQTSAGLRKKKSPLEYPLLSAGLKNKTKTIRSGVYASAQVCLAYQTWA